MAKLPPAILIFRLIHACTDEALATLDRETNFGKSRVIPLHPTTVKALLQTFFTDRLIAQRRVSPHTVASYRDTFRLLLQFA